MILQVHANWSLRYRLTLLDKVVQRDDRLWREAFILKSSK